jgi:hypothetical protein
MLTTADELIGSPVQVRQRRMPPASDAVVEEKFVTETVPDTVGTVNSQVKTGRVCREAEVEFSTTDVWHLEGCYRIFEQEDARTPFRR